MDTPEEARKQIQVKLGLTAKEWGWLCKKLIPIIREDERKRIAKWLKPKESIVKYAGFHEFIVDKPDYEALKSGRDPSQEGGE